MFRFAFIIVIALFSKLLIAQEDGYKSTISFSTGFSVVKTFVDKAIVLSNVVEAKTTSLPAFQCDFDYKINELFALGIGASYQIISVKYDDYEFVNEYHTVILEDFYTDINRINIAARLMLQYNPYPRLDLYHGIRLGYTSWNWKTGSTDPNYDIDLKFGLFAAQVVLLGVRGYVTEHVGFGGELAIGAPHFLNVGVKYRL